MIKPTIVIDLDNVLALSAKGFVASSNELFGTSITIEDYGEDWETMWGVPHEEAERRGEEMRARKIQRDFEPVPGAKEVLMDLTERYSLVILTSRRKQTESFTKEWLERYYPGVFSDVYFSGFFEAEIGHGGHLLTKGEQYEKMKAAYVIDDYLKHCESAAKVNINAVLFGDYPWNRSGELTDRITRCNDWSAVRDYFISQALPATITEHVEQS